MFADLALWSLDPGVDTHRLQEQIDSATGRWVSAPGLEAKAWILSGNQVGAMTWWRQPPSLELLPPNLLAQELGRQPDQRQAFQILAIVNGAES